MNLRCRQFTVPLDPKTLLMGIVNITEDSFSGDGLLATDENVVEKVGRLRNDGMDITDVGGETARTNRGPISEQEEINRVCPAIEQLVARFPDLPISVNTWRPKVVDAALQAGAHIVNDIGGLPDDTNARLAARHGASLVIMHTQGEPKVPHTHVKYPDVMADMLAWFEQKISLAMKAGLIHEQILLDPGLDFAKQLDDNLHVIRHLSELKRFSCPLLLAPSRKTVIGDILGVPPAGRDAGTAALCVLGIQGGADVLRVHNVRAMRDVARMTDAILRSPSAARAI